LTCGDNTLTCLPYIPIYIIWYPAAEGRESAVITAWGKPFSDEAQINRGWTGCIHGEGGVVDGVDTVWLAVVVHVHIAKVPNAVLEICCL